MCGIIGYTGYREAYSVLLDGLKRLEYRGYDSAGIGVIDKKLQIYKQVGEISQLAQDIPHFKGNIGIGHTRWATHGMVNQVNAHPQMNCKQDIAVVHNGIIDNFQDLKKQLQDTGHEFVSNTDTEVIAHLIDHHFRDHLVDAVRNSVDELKGSFALVVISEKDPKVIVVARNESPLVIGIGDNENLVASDIPALLKYTNRVQYLDDGEVGVIDKKKVTIFNREGKPIYKETHLVSWDMQDAEKGGYAHFMLKEIHEQPHSITQGLVGRISEIDRSVTFHDRVESVLINGYDSIQLVACGTSYYAGFVGKYLIEQLTNIPVQVNLASEYRYFSPTQSDSLVIAITQSGETADTLGALRTAKKMGCRTLVITNVIGSTATRLADGYILTQSGPEIGVAATKTFTSQIVMLILLALKIAKDRNKLGSDELYHILVELKELPRLVRQVLEQTKDIKKIAERLSQCQSIFFIGRGLNYPLALEGALKLKEISYIHAEGFAAGELKHGPFALLTKDTPVVAVAMHDEAFSKMIANIGEIKARGSPVIAVSDDERDVANLVDEMVICPCSSNILSCIPIAVFFQLLAYYVADKRKCPIDKPRNLAKSVTVD